VWRNEKPGPGRFREFTQCDADTVGSDRPEADAEIIAMAGEGLRAAGLNADQAVIRVSNRKLFDGLFDAGGVTEAGQRLTALRAIDKFDRLGWEGVVQLLGEGRLDESGDYTGIANPAKAKALLAEAGYKGEPVVLMRPTDNPTIGKLPLVAKQQLEQAGFKVDMQSMDWSTLVARRAKKDAPSAGGWSAFMTSWTASDILNPITMAMMNATGDKGWFGWQTDARLEEIKVQFAQAKTDAEKKKLAQAAQLRAF
jgi:ABC-type transport system substrate-binding protein